MTGPDIYFLTQRLIQVTLLVALFALLTEPGWLTLLAIGAVPLAVLSHYITASILLRRRTPPGFKIGDAPKPPGDGIC
jgi:hypothetical protein